MNRSGIVGGESDEGHPRQQSLKLAPKWRQASRDELYPEERRGLSRVRHALGRPSTVVEWPLT